MKTTNRIKGIRMTLAAGLLLAAAGTAAGETIDAGRPNFAEMAGPSIRLQAEQAMISIRHDLRLRPEDVAPVPLERPASAVIAASETDGRTENGNRGAQSDIAGGLVIYIGNR